ncbi:MAG: AAA family ATPase [Saprospiraceae bacterium]|nr:AAA family ATPase [Saprospiraceae bacterium]
MFYRSALEYLVQWKASTRRKPLIIRGARQVGKTTLVKQFAQTYKQNILLNLEKTPDRIFFETTDDVKKIIESLFLAKNLSPNIEDTLLFIDEIQESPKAIQLLRYFYEEFPNLHVISAGSLLEFAMRNVPSFPVGRVEFLYLYPLNFFEYLTAIKHTAALEQINQIPIKPFAHKVLTDLFNRYAIIGGMPEVVDVFIDNDNSLLGLPKVYNSIWGTYQNDVEKYARNEMERKVIKHIMATAYFHVDKRIKFQNFGNSNYKSREIGEAMRSLDDAKIIQIIYPTTDVEIPIKPDFKKSPRLQFLDTGLVNHSLGLQSQMIGLQDLSSTYKGAIIPHLITQELISLNTMSSKNPHFWVREKKQSSSEVDLVLQYENKVIPVEIKSGSTGSLKSLHQFVEIANHPYAVRIYQGEFKIEKTKTPSGIPYLLMNLPYYLGTKIPEYLDYFVKNNNL